MRFRCFPILLLILLFFVMKPLNSVLAAGPVNENETPILQFPVISDIHIDEQASKDQFKNALADLKIIAPNYQAIATVGDNTNAGTNQQYNDFMNLLTSFSNPGSEKIITIGNHEYFEGRSSSQGLDEELYQNRFVENTGMPGLYYDKWVSGYHFIALATEGFLKPDDPNHAKISDAQYTWLEQTLAKNADSEKPIFVFLHQPIDHTVYGSDDDWGAGFTDTRLLDLLKQYPQVILFTGHSHYSLNHPRTIYQDGFTMVNDGAVAYGWTDLGYQGTSQGLLVNVFKDRVEIKARDLTNHSWIQTLTVKVPFEKTYGETQKPVFNQDSAVSVDKNSTGDSVTLSWDPAKDDSLIDKYYIKQNGKIIYTAYTKYWEPTPAKITATIPNLNPETVYNLEITGVDVWNNESSNQLFTVFKTSKLNGWKLINNKWFYYIDGSVVTDWHYINGSWYYFLNDGTMLTGWLTNGGHRYYLNQTGAVATGWFMVSSKWYYAENDGSIKLGWLLYKDKWYYLKTDGMIAGWFKNSNGTWYYFDNNGAMKSGWIQLNKLWYYLDNTGAMRTGWTQINKTWYYLDNSGAMKSGWIVSSNKRYYLESSGAMKTGWLYDNKKWYYFRSDGSIQTGKVKIGQAWYSFNTDGSLR